MKGDYPAKYVGIREVAACLCPPEQKGQSYQLTANMSGRQMSQSMNLNEFIFNFQSVFGLNGFRFKMQDH